MADAPRILLVDDEHELVQLMRLRLEAHEYQVMTAFDGQEGLEKARTAKPDLIVLDLMLPKLNGYEVCTMLKQDGRYQHIPIVMFTAKASEKEYWQGMEAGANAYLAKPFTADDLQQIVNRLIAALQPGILPSRRGEAS